MKKFYNYAKFLLLLVGLSFAYSSSAQCNISVTFSSTGYGDVTTWQLLDGSGATVLSGGTYGFGYTDVQNTIGSNPPYSLSVTVNNANWCDNTPNYSVTVGGVQDIAGTVNVGCTNGSVTLPLNSAFVGCSAVQPPSPLQDPASPTCSAGTALTVAGSPAANNVWYWQTSATGTLTTNPYLGAYNVYNNGTYYVRSLNTVTNIWSTSSSVIVSNMPVATTPLAPIAGANPACVTNGTTLSLNSPIPGYEYYWQGTTVNGVSNANNASTPLPVTTTGTYTVAAFDPATQCWSPTASTLVTVDTYIPQQPTVTVSNYNICSGETTLPISIDPFASSGNVTLSFGTNLNSPGPATLFPVTVPALPSGATITSAQLLVTSVNSINGSWRSEARVGLSGIFTLAATQISALNSGGLITPDPVINLTSFPTTGGTLNLVLSESYDDGSFNVPNTIDATFGQVQLVINYTVPATTVSWYDAATAGNTLGTGTPFETVGTSVLSNPATFGTYEFYAGSVSGGCTSVNRTLVTVNVVDVNAVLTPINATCNGGNNGSFALGTVECGATPFTYSLDNGVTFGAIPTNLSAGNYSVIIEDANGLQSGNILVVVAQPAAPSNVTMGQINYFSAEVSWTTTGNETSWNVEVGPAGFTPGTGTSYTANTNFFTIPGLTEDTDYDVYISAICGPNPELSDVVSFSTNPGFFTFDNQCGPGFIDISATGTNLNLFDDTQAGITLPWAWDVNGVAVNTITVGNNGGVLFNTTTGFVGYNSVANGMFPYIQDLNTALAGGGVYYQNIGTAPNQQFVIMWQDLAHYTFPAATDGATFELIVDEATGEIYFVYEDVNMSNPSWDNGADAEITINTANGNAQVSMNNATYLTNNSCAHFYNALCPNPTNMVTTVSQEQIDLDWTAGAYGETDWTVIYGPVGFDPATSGTILTTTTSDIQITGLTQVTEYDIYIYSECTIDNLTSDGFLVNAVTLPWCPDPITLNATSEVDSIMMTWDWIPAVGATNGGISSFNIEYGQTGYNLYSGTELVANGVDFADTIDNAAFLPGQVIDVYVQSVCGVDSSNYVGPFTITMPISNDTVCGAEELMVDGTVYIFNNTGATVTAGETGIVPSQTGYNATDLPQAGWGQPTLQRTTWFTFTAPASGSIRFSGEDVDAFWSQIAIYDAPICNDFNTFELLAASDQATVTTTTIGNTTTIDTFKVAPNFTICGLTPGNTYYIMHDSWAGASGASTLQGEYSIAMTPINLEAGTFVDVLDACTGTSVVLFDGIAGYQAAGSWTAELAPAGTGLTDSLFNTSGLGYQVFDFEYRVTDGCAYDSIVAQVQIFPLSSAGTDGTITVCKNEPVDLLSGLGGNVDLGGSWYNPSNQLMPSSSIYASSIPGQFNYDYITGNGVCPDDTANVLLTVDPTCDWLNVEEMYFSSMTLLPNPTNGLVYITNEGNSEVYNYEVIDVDGRVIASKANAINGASTTTIDLTGKVTGMYMIRVYNGNAEKVFRVVLQ